MPAEIKNVFVLLLENRSFDHMLGFSGIAGTNAETGQPTEINGPTGKELNGYLGAPYPVGRRFHEPIAVDPAHEFLDVLEQLCGAHAIYKPGEPYPDINLSGFVSDYARSHTKDEGNAPGNFGHIMDGFTADQLPVLNALARAYAVCDGWHSSLPGPTFPNRLFAMAATSGGLDHSPSNSELITGETVDGFSFANGSIFDALKGEFGDDAWRIYAGSHFPLIAALKGIDSVFDVKSMEEFGTDIRSGNYPWRLTWIEPDYGDMVNGTFLGGTSQHPMDCVSHGEGLIKTVYESIRNSPVWESSLLIVTWDEHGGFYDHVPPGEAVPPGDSTPGKGYNKHGFNFTRLGVRVPAVVVSPWIPKGTIDHRAYDHTSIPKTLEDIFGLSHLTARDEVARSVQSLLTLAKARSDAPVALPMSLPPNERADQLVRPGSDSVNSGNLPVFLHIAMRHEVSLSHPDKKAAVLNRVRGIHTRAQAQQYLGEMKERVTEAKMRRGASNVTTGAATQEAVLEGESPPQNTTA